MTGVERLSAAALRHREQELRGVSEQVVVIETGDQDTRKAFFDAVRAAVDLDPPVVSERSWDALEDSLWEGIHNLDARSVLIVWPDADRFAAAAPGEFEEAESVLAEVARSLADPRYTGAAEPTDVTILVARPV